MNRSDMASACGLLLSTCSGDRSRLERFRDARLRDVVRHAHEHVPYYRGLLDRDGIDPRSIRGVADLARLPITSKADLQAAAPEDRVARTLRPERWITRRTTGSTGQPLEIRRTWAEERLLGALRWRALRSLGARLTDRFAEIEEPLGPEPNDRRTLHVTFERLGLFRQERIDARAAPADVLRRLSTFRADVVSGYAGVLARLADVGRIEELASIRPHLVVTHSDTSTPRIRDAIARAFRAPVRQLYDCNEVNVVAWECPRAGVLHVNDDAVIVEVRAGDRPAAPGELGEVLLTSLHSRAMPFLRYRIGDLAVQGDDRCECGLAISTIRRVVGRMFDYFPLANGRVVHPYEIIAVLEDAVPKLVRYRITQLRRDHVRVELVAGEVRDAEVLESARRAIEGRLAPGVRVDVWRVDDLDPEGGAKLRACRSLVFSEYDELPGTGGGHPHRR